MYIKFNQRNLFFVFKIFINLNKSCNKTINLLSKKYNIDDEFRVKNISFDTPELSISNDGDNIINIINHNLTRQH